MPFGSPESNTTTATYAATFEHTNGTPITLKREEYAGAPGDPALFDAAFAAAVAALDASPDFTYLGGGKSYNTNQQYTL